MRKMPGLPKRLPLGMIGATLIGAMLAGCSGVPVPKEQLAVSQAAVNEATRSGAPEHAPAELRSAREKLDRARQAVKDHEYERARQFAEQAEVDARLAQAKAGSERARVAADQVQESLEVLRQELNTTSGSRGG